MDSVVNICVWNLFFCEFFSSICPFFFVSVSASFHPILIYSPGVFVVYKTFHFICLIIQLVYFTSYFFVLFFILWARAFVQPEFVRDVDVKLKYGWWMNAFFSVCSSCFIFPMSIFLFFIKNGCTGEKRR